MISASPVYSVPEGIWLNMCGRKEGYLKTAGDLREDSCTLVVACAIVPAADDAVFGLPEIERGIFPIVVPLFCSVQSGEASASDFSHQGIGSAPKKQTGDSCA